MNNVLNTYKSGVFKVMLLALVAAATVSFSGHTKADTFFNLTINVSDACGPVEAQAVIVNGPDDGAFGITSGGHFTFNLHAGVFYVHFSAANHASADSGTVVLNSNQSINMNLSRNDSCPGTTPPPPPVNPTPPPPPVNPTPPPPPVNPPPPPVATFYDLTVNTTDICGPISAQAVIVNGPDDGAFGITDANGHFTFHLHAGVFYVHFSAANHANKDSGTVVLNSNQTISINLDRSTPCVTPVVGTMSIAKTARNVTQGQTTFAKSIVL